MGGGRERKRKGERKKGKGARRPGEESAGEKQKQKKE
jgi:hypothetical protein